MSDLREVRQELEAKRKEAAALEAKLRQAEAEPLAEAIKQAILEDSEACAFLCSLGKDELRLMCRLVAESLAKAGTNCPEELEHLRQKKRDKAEKRRVREAARKGAVDTMTSNSMEGGTPQTAWTGGDAF